MTVTRTVQEPYGEPKIAVDGTVFVVGRHYSKNHNAATYVPGTSTVTGGQNRGYHPSSRPFRTRLRGLYAFLILKKYLLLSLLSPKRKMDLVAGHVLGHVRSWCGQMTSVKYAFTERPLSSGTDWRSW